MTRRRFLPILVLATAVLAASHSQAGPLILSSLRSVVSGPSSASADPNSASFHSSLSSSFGSASQDSVITTDGLSGSGQFQGVSSFDSGTGITSDNESVIDVTFQTIIPVRFTITGETHGIASGVLFVNPPSGALQETLLGGAIGILGTLQPGTTYELRLFAISTGPTLATGSWNVVLALPEPTGLALAAIAALALFTRRGASRARSSRPRAALPSFR